MSRYDITGPSTGDVQCGWDEGLGTFFLQGFGCWFGTTYAEWTTPERLIRYAKRRDARPPAGTTWGGLAQALRADQAARPARAADELTVVGIPLGNFRVTPELNEALDDLRWTETMRGRITLLRHRLWPEH